MSEQFDNVPFSNLERSAFWKFSYDLFFQKIKEGFGTFKKIDDKSAKDRYDRSEIFYDAHHILDIFALWRQLSYTPL